METLPNNIEKLIENLPVITLDNNQEFQKVITSTEFTQIFNFYKENYLPDILKSKSEIYQRISLYLTITGQGEQFTEQTDQVLYRRPVPTIEEFLDNSRYLGLQNQNMFSYWRKQLLHIFAENSSINRALWSGATGTGKALSNDTIIPTLNGKKRVDEIKVGDYLWGKNGKPTKVLGVYPQGKKKIYEIIFNDGTSVECSDNHLWQIDYLYRNKLKKPKIFSTKQLIEGGISKQYNNENTPRYKFAIDSCHPIEYSEKTFEIHPYILGVLLGDGCLRKNDTYLIINKNETEIAKKISKLLPDDFFIKITKSFKNTNGIEYVFLNKNCVKTRNNYKYKGFHHYIDDLGLTNKKAWDKFIPENYLEGSIEQRYELLKGLMDTDGSIRNRKNSKKSEIVYTTTSNQLALDIAKLVRSLGGKAHIIKTELSKLMKTNNLAKHDRYNVFIQILKNPFFLKQKSEKYKITKLTPKRIININETNKEKECTCFEVDSDDHLFLCNDYIVTHNTVTARKAIIYSLYKLLCLRYPRATLNVEEGSTLACFILSVTQKTAYQTNFEPFVRILTGMPCFQRVRNVSAFDNFDLENPNMPFPFYVDKSNLTIVFKDNFILTLGSQISNTVGYDVVLSAADEVNELGVEAGMELLNSIDGRVQGRFAGSPFIAQHVMSSARSTDSVTREYVKKWQADPNFLYLHPMRFEVKSSADFTSKTSFFVQIGNGSIPSMIIKDEGLLKKIENDLYIPPAGCELIKVPDLYRPQFEADMNQSVQDILGIDTNDNNSVFRDTTRLEDPLLTPEISLEVNLRDNCNILDMLLPYDLFEQDLNGKWQFKRAPKAQRYGHCDLASGGNEGQCDASICILHKEWQYNEITRQKDTIYVVDLLLFINAKNKIDLHAIQNFLIDLVTEKNISIHTISSDQWNGEIFLQALEASGCFTEVKKVSVDNKLEPYINYANLIEAGQVKIGKCPKLKKELEALILVKGKVTRTTELKDGADSSCGAIYNAQMNYNDTPIYEYKDKIEIKNNLYESMIDLNNEDLIDFI